MILTILQARMSSTRLPGKVLKPILGEPMLLRQIERVRRARSIQHLIIATSTGPEDDAIADLCRAEGLECFRGSLDDVLDRFYQAALPHRPRHVMRLTGDCPLTDPEVLDRLTTLHRRKGSDYTSTSIVPSFPEGLDAEIMRFSCLEEAWKEAFLPSQREHVTPFFYQQPHRFRLAHLKCPQDLSALRWTVDEPEDFELVTHIFEGLLPTHPTFGMREVLKFLEAHPDLAKLNQHHRRGEGYRKSLRLDAQYLGHLPIANS